MTQKKGFLDKVIGFLEKLAWHFGIPPTEKSPSNTRETKKSVSKSGSGKESNVKTNRKQGQTKEQSKKTSQSKKEKSVKDGSLKEKTIRDDRLKEKRDEKSEKIVFTSEDLSRFLNNDVSLKDIATVKELQSLDTNHMYVPTLLSDKLLVFNKNMYNADNFYRFFLYMIVNKEKEHTLQYKNCGFTAENIDIIIDLLTKSFERVRNDYIEYFSAISGVSYKTSVVWLSENIVKDLNIVVSFKADSSTAFEDTFKFLKLCRYVKSELVKKGKISDSMSQIEKAKVLYNWVVLHTEYENDKSESKLKYSGYAAILKGKAVCQGYTAMYNALCRLCNIDVYGMVGICADRETGAYEHHIWTLANISNKKIFIDSTWGRPNIENKEELKREGWKVDLFCDFSWFNSSYKEFVKKHSWDKKVYPI